MWGPWIGSSWKSRRFWSCFRAGRGTHFTQEDLKCSLVFLQPGQMKRFHFFLSMSCCCRFQTLHVSDLRSVNLHFCRLLSHFQPQSATTELQLINTFNHCSRFILDRIQIKHSPTALRSQMLVSFLTSAKWVFYYWDGVLHMPRTWTHYGVKSVLTVVSYSDLIHWHHWPSWYTDLSSLLRVYLLKIKL